MRACGRKEHIHTIELKKYFYEDNNMKKLLYYCTPLGYGHITRSLAIVDELRRYDIHTHIVSSLDHIFEIPKNAEYHKITDISGISKLSEEIYYEDVYKRPLSGQKGIYNYRKHVFEYMDLLKNINPELVVVDVTPEFAVYSKLLGYRTVSIYLTGKKTDLRCKVSYGSSDFIVPPYHKSMVDVSYWPQSVQKKMYFSGGFSRFDKYKKLSKEEAKKVIGIPEYKKVVVCTFGGSSWGTSIKKKVANIFKKEKLLDVELIILEKERHIEKYLNAADLVISGAGDNTIMENCYFRVPMILIPLDCWYNEQVSKAEKLSEIGAADVINQKDVNSKILCEKIEGLLGDKKKIDNMINMQNIILDGEGAKRFASKLNEWAKG